MAAAKQPSQPDVATIQHGSQGVSWRLPNVLSRDKAHGKLWTVPFVAASLVLILLATVSWNFPQNFATLTSVGVRASQLLNPACEREPNIEGDSKEDTTAILATPPIADLALPPNADIVLPGDASSSLRISEWAMPMDNYTALCACIRLLSTLEHADLREWVLHHVYYFGMRVYIYDHESVPPLSIVLGDYIDSNYVEVIPFTWPREHIPQAEASRQCLDLMRERGHMFVGFIDWDEFLWQSPYWKAQPLRNYLKQFEDEGGLGINWVFYGSGTLEKHQIQGVRKAYVCCYTDGNRHVKSFIRPAYLPGYRNPHVYNLGFGKQVVDSMHRPTLEFNTIEYNVENISLHHYVCKSREDFAEKIGRGSGDGQGKGWDFFAAQCEDCNDKCTDLARLLV